jgi:hypothetical protein
VDGIDGDALRSWQGCQILVDKIFQNGGKLFTTKLPNGRKIYQMAIKYTKGP